MNLRDYYYCWVFVLSSVLSLTCAKCNERALVVPDGLHTGMHRNDVMIEDVSMSILLLEDSNHNSAPIAALERYKRLIQIRGGFSPAAASLLAGSFAGAVGVGVAFPLDTLKTKSQVMGRAAADLNMLGLIRAVYRTEGIKGFFGGVRGMMAGQALIKATAFSANTFALKKLRQHPGLIMSSITILMIAAAFAGFVTSFIVAPVERVKVMMQASDLYANEIECIRAVLRAEGITGLLGRGLNPTILREIPSYCIYFVIYGILMRSRFFSKLGIFAPCICGAIR